jgi:hypothetical protein
VWLITLKLWLSNIGSKQLRVTSDYGTLDIGCLNATWAHFQTAATSGFYFYKGINTPATIQADQGFIGNLTGNANTATLATTALSANNSGTLDGIDSTGFARAYSASLQFGNGANWTTIQFIDFCKSQGALSSPYWMAKASWSYAANNHILDTGCGDIGLAGATVEVIGNPSAFTIRVTTAPAMSGAGMPNAVFLYQDHGPSYSPGWSRMYSTKDKPSLAELGAASSSHTHPWAQVTGAPATATRWPTAAEAGAAPSSHTHPWAQVTGAPATATRWPTIAEIGAAPSTHTHNPTQVGLSNYQNASSGTHCAVTITGSKGGYSGIHFPDAAGQQLMVHTDVQGFYKAGAWSWYFNKGVLTTGTVPWANISDQPATATRWPSAAEAGAVLSRTRSNWKSSGVESNVVGQLSWANYGSNHTIFDASAGTTPTGVVCDKSNAAIAWSGTYPTLMGYNGSATYGVRVDSARTADNANNANTAGGLAVGTGVNSTANQIVRTNSSGYIDAGWINTVSGVAAGAPIRIYCSQDAYLRYYSPAQVAPYILTQGSDKNAHTHAYFAENGSYGTMHLNNWYRSTGATGWYSDTWGGGIHMQDSIWIRTYGGKKFHVANTENNAIDTAGGVVAAQNVTAYSDIRIKTDIQVIDNALDKISQIRGVTYTRTDLDTARQTGVIAQELRKVLPEAVIESTSDLECIKDGKLLTVAYGNVVGLLIEGIKEEKAERERLVDEVYMLKDMLIDMQQQINAIRGGF